MSLKRDLAKKIETLEKEMQMLESKRSRSMAALLEALISRREPNEIELQYFRQYSSEIEFKREKLIEYTARLKSLM